MKKDQGSKWQRYLKEIISTGIIVLVILAFRSTFFSHYNVPTGSMIPTIHPGDHFLANQVHYGLRVPFSEIFLTEVSSPERGDVVVFPSPVDPDIDLVKRVVAIGGDVIAVDDGRIVLNGEHLPLTPAEGIESPGAQVYWETLGKVKHLTQYYVQDPRNRYMDSYVVPEGHFFVMGDNRDDSADGRIFKAVPNGKLRARAMFILYSVDQNEFPFLSFSRTGNSLRPELVAP